MTILDTNVISEVVKPSPSERVAAWMRSLPEAETFTTSITEAEMLLGIEIMPAGKRREALRVAVERILKEGFGGRILPFDSPAARCYAEIFAKRRRMGRSTSEPDAQILAIARARGYALATRNVEDFVDCGVTLINPWEA